MSERPKPILWLTAERDCDLVVLEGVDERGATVVEWIPLAECANDPSIRSLLHPSWKPTR